jgi:hypothetical protein
MLSDSTPASPAPDAPEEGQNESVDPLTGLPVVPHHVNKEIFQSAMRALVILLIALAVLGTVVGYLVGGLPGVWGALLGVAVALVFSGTTIWSMLHTADKSPNYTMGVVLGAWIGKMFFFVIVLAVLGQFSFYHKVVFAIVILIGVIGSALLDMWAVAKGRQPYVTPSK